jgi:hypothetical protein
LHYQEHITSRQDETRQDEYNILTDEAALCTSC